MEATKCPSVDEWIKKMWYIYVCVCVCVYNEILWDHEKEWNVTICSNMDESRLSGVNQTEKDNYISLVCGI